VPVDREIDAQERFRAIELDARDRERIAERVPDLHALGGRFAARYADATFAERIRALDVPRIPTLRAVDVRGEP
jgi:hypothetical protein